MRIGPPVAHLRHAERRARLAAVLAAANLDGLLVTDLVNVRYLTGFTGSNGALLLGAGADAPAVFSTDFRYTEQAREEAGDLEMHTARASDLALVELAGSGRWGARRTDAVDAGALRLGFEEHLVTVARHRELERAAADVAAHLTLVGTTGRVERLRAVKDEAEIRSVSAACALADAALAEAIAAGEIRAGRTEAACALDLDERMRRLGSDDISFPTILAAGEHSAIPHHRPSVRELHRGDLVKIDFGAVVNGYHSDMTRMFVLGPPAGWQTDLYDLVAAAQAAGRDACRAGTELSAIDTAAREVIADAGHGDKFGHGLGHGVGLEVHEAPWLGASSAGIMEPDMTVTVEPGVYLPGRGGVRIEDSGVVEPDGFRPLTLSPRELVAL